MSISDCDKYVNHMFLLVFFMRSCMLIVEIIHVCGLRGGLDILGSKSLIDVLSVIFIIESGREECYVPSFVVVYQLTGRVNQ